MVIKVYVSLTSGNFQIKNQQDKVRQVLQTLQIPFEEVDISSADNKEERDFMKENAVKKEGKNAILPPQVFNDADYCGDFDDFDNANECETMEEFLKLKGVSQASVTVTSDVNAGGDQ